jgi:RNA polymerase sigma-70 factor (ECF subfamily)
MVTDWKSVLTRVRAALMRRGRTTDDADDLVQEAWMRLTSYEAQAEVASPEALLMRIALNLSIDSHRSRASRGESVELEDVVLLDCAPTAECIVLGRERLARLSVCLGRLNDRTRLIFLSHRVDGLTYQEIAHQHGLSVSTVEKHVAKATLHVTSWMEGW